MREIQELSTEHKSLNSLDTTEGTVLDTTEKTIVINADPVPHIDTNQFNQMLGRKGRDSMGQHSSIPVVVLYLERLAVNVKVATILGSIPASSETFESEGRLMKQYGITYIKNKKIEK